MGEPAHPAPLGPASIPVQTQPWDDCLLTSSRVGSPALWHRHQKGDGRQGLC